MVGDVGIAVHIVPASVNNQAVGGDAGVPFMSLMETQAGDVAAVGSHGVQGINRAIAPAAQKAPAPFGNEGDRAIG